MSWLVRVTVTGAMIAGLCSQAAAEEPSAAELLYLQGVNELRLRHLDKACPILRESYHLEQQPKALFYLAECEEAAGRIATAAALYDKYLDEYDRLTEGARSLEGERLKDAGKRREALEDQIPNVTFSIADPPPGMRATRKFGDKGDLVDVAIGVPLPIDPGSHWVATRAPDRPPWETQFTIARGEKKTIELEVAPRSSSSASTYSRPIEPVPNVLPPLDPGPSTQRIIAYSTLGLGAAGIVFGLIAGGITWSDKSTIESNCLGNLCNREGESAKDNAHTWGIVSNVSSIVGAVSLTTGIILFVAEPAPPRIGGGTGKLRLDLSPALQGGIVKGTYQW